jgi:hypothetical protein
MGRLIRRRRPVERAMRLWPLVAVLSLLAFVGIFMLCSDDLIDRMGNQTIWSEALFLSTVSYGIAVLFSAIAWWRAPERVSAPRGSRVFEHRHHGLADLGFLPGLLGCHRTQDLDLGEKCQ